jgi:transposase-like protein
MGLSDRHQPGGPAENNRAENSHLPVRRRERKQQRFKSQGPAQRFLATPALIYNPFKLQPQLISRSGQTILRPEAHAVWVNSTAVA